MFRCSVGPTAVAGVSRALTSTLVPRVPTLNTGSLPVGTQPVGARQQPAGEAHRKPAVGAHRKPVAVQVRPASVVVQTVDEPCAPLALPSTRPTDALSKPMNEAALG